MMFQVKLMKNQMPVLIGQIHGDFKMTELWASVCAFKLASKIFCHFVSNLRRYDTISAQNVYGNLLQKTSALYTRL